MFKYQMQFFGFGILFFYFTRIRAYTLQQLGQENVPATVYSHHVHIRAIYAYI